MKTLYTICLLVLCLPSQVRADTYVVIFNSFDDGKGTETNQVAAAMKNNAKGPVQLHYIHKNNSSHKTFSKNMEWLKKNATGNDDLVIIFVYADGSSDGGKGNLSISSTDGGFEPTKEIRETTESLPGTSIVLIDCCESGGALKETWKRTTVVCASSAKEASVTGGMAKATCEIMRREGDLTVGKMASYLERRIHALIKYQHPQVYLGKGLNSPMK
jgi:hypothetical protein